MQPNNPNQFTEKAWEALARTPEVVKAAQQQQLESEHLMKALLEQESGLASSLFNKAAVSVAKLRDRTDEFISRQPKIHWRWRQRLSRPFPGYPARQG
jgi:ATP-dependent Clp protease ATP-binding subunit ClpB